MIGILKGILGQAISWRPEVMAYFDEQRKSGGEPIICREQTTKKLTEIVCRGGDQTYLVVDGIDECSPKDRKSTLLFLNNLVRDNDEKYPGKLRLLVISQNEPDIRKLLNNPRELIIQPGLIDADIQSFVAQHTPTIASFGLESEEVEMVQQKICRNAAGISYFDVIRTIR